MKSLSITKATSRVEDAALVPGILDKANVEWQLVDTCNWPEEFPYTPKAEFRIALSDNAFLVNYRATEDSVKATYAEDNGSVWTDSCMEFFLSPNPEDGIYYNLECNCIGTPLLGVRGDSVEKTHGTPEVMKTIKRWSSMGHEAFEERVGEQTWEVALIVPFTAYWHHNLKPQEGMKLRANFYKCGDDLQKPHFLSWNPINFKQPNFHLPEFFGELIIENV